MTSIKDLNPKPIVQRICVLCKMRLLSPALIGSSDDYESDRDVPINSEGYPFIPGSTLAGILRATLNPDDANLLFGKSENGKTKQSPLWVYDAIIKTRGESGQKEESSGGAESDAEVESTVDSAPAAVPGVTPNPAFANDTDSEPAEPRPAVEPARIITIDSVSLDENQRNAKEQMAPELDHMNKIAKGGAKFDFQAVDTGSLFDIRLMLIIRAGDDDQSDDKQGDDKLESSPELTAPFETLHKKVLSQLNNLYVGGKTSRGFGKLACDEIYSRTFDFTGDDKENQLDQWLNFKDWNTLACEEFKDDKNKCELNEGNENKGNDTSEDNNHSTLYSILQVSKYSHLTANLKIEGSVLVRDIYSIEEDEDYAHTYNDGKSVIYGTSWAGAIRGGLAKLLKSNGYDTAEKYLDSVFGRQFWDGKKYVTEPSKVRIDASYICGGERIKYTRNKIDRFTGGAANTALLKSRPHFGGECKLNIYFAKGEDERDIAIKELFLLALDAISKGLITLGGETSVGRGVFKVGEVLIDGVKTDFDKEKSTLKKVICGE